MKLKHKRVLVKGEDNLTCSIAVCLLNAGHSVVLCTGKEDAREAINNHLSEQEKVNWWTSNNIQLQVTNDPPDLPDCGLGILITPEDRDIKISAVRRMQQMLGEDAVIAINTECVALSEIQTESAYPSRIIGVNWSEPAHTTLFLEIISNSTTDTGIADEIDSIARKLWRKDPYVLTGDLPIRSRMIAAMVREAFYLIENGYVSAEDVDRACRNDAGYYLPFSGHCRYMDLMGTWIYGRVMEDLNPELSKDTKLPEFFNEMVRSGADGMANGRGFYTYGPGKVEERTAEFRKFSYEIAELILRYPPYRGDTGTVFQKKMQGAGHSVTPGNESR
jgi:3-hydroxybutyryl-CoA dehydrogenase